MRRQQGEQASGLGLVAGSAAVARPWLPRPSNPLKMMQGAATSQLLPSAAAAPSRAGSDWHVPRPSTAAAHFAASQQPQGMTGTQPAPLPASLRQFKFLSQSQPQPLLPWSQPSQSYDVVAEHTGTEVLLEAGGSCPQVLEGLGQSQDTNLHPSQTAQRLLNEISRRVMPAADDPTIQTIIKKLEATEGGHQALQDVMVAVQEELAVQRAQLDTIQGTCAQLLQLLQSAALKRDDGLLYDPLRESSLQAARLADGATQTSMLLLPRAALTQGTWNYDQSRASPAVQAPRSGLTSMLRVTHATAGANKRKHDGTKHDGRLVKASLAKSGQSWGQQPGCEEVLGSQALQQQAPKAAVECSGASQAPSAPGNAVQPEDDIARKVLKKMQRHRQKLLQQQLLKAEER